MGQKDTKAKDYLADNARFADICNVKLFNGREVIKPENLEEQDSTEVLDFLTDGGKNVSLQKWRDVLKICKKVKDIGYIVIIGLEAQSEINYAMPVKCDLYDVINYGKQVDLISKQHRKNKESGDKRGDFTSGFFKSDSLVPVITITVYLGTEMWDGPRSLHDMMDVKDSEILQYVPDYRLNLFIPSEVEDFSGFKTGAGKLFKILSMAVDKEKLKKIDSDEFSSVDVETVMMVNEFTQLNVEIPRNGGNVNVCKAVQEWKEELLQEGEVRGEARGVISTLVSLVNDGLISKSEGVSRSGLSEKEFDKYLKKINSHN